MSKKVIRKLSSLPGSISIAKAREYPRANKPQSLDYSYYHKGTSYNSHRLNQHSSDYNLKQRPIKNRKVKKKYLTKNNRYNQSLIDNKKNLIANSIPIYNENSNHSGTDDTEDNFSNDVLNRYMDEETQMALMDNIEYDLNDDYIDEESKINSNSKLTRNEATNFSNKFPKAEASESIECKPSTSNFKADTSKKTRLTKSESNTAMSNSDQAVSKNKRGRGKKVIQSDEDDTNASSDTEEYEENDTNRARMNGRSKKKINDDFYENEDKSDASSLNQEDDEDFGDDSFNQNEISSSKKNRKKSKKAKKTRSNDKNSMSKRPVRSCRSMDNKENNETFLSRNKKSTLNKTASSYSTRSSKRARKADYREFSTSDDDSNDDESQQKSRKKRSNSRKKPKKPCEINRLRICFKIVQFLIQEKVFQLDKDPNVFFLSRSKNILISRPCILKKSTRKKKIFLSDLY
ncbi:hypothetical protein BpHYR1_037892 [Brachionus plicatilis]|uniref:Uncharacterized protein n=1 Tax=Brachionus plicatilis TaxID=10195 RepID=A0A3M7QM81_BRAPC|nr:hypothetical protein BpHYR1_037892 [Brachionus plicatilis]